MLYEDYRVYIEGIQVPFNSIRISNVYQQNPTADISLPPFSGLQEIGRNYQPKVEIFFRDYNYGITPNETISGATRATQQDGYKLIFSGIIGAMSDTKSISSNGAQQQITLQAVHPSRILSDILIRYSSQLVQGALNETDPTATGATTTAEFSRETAMIKALQGISATAGEDSHQNVADAAEALRLQGTPGMIRVLWNILKLDARRNIGSNDSEAMTDMFTPMVEDGIKFWKRMTGHPTIESGIATSTYNFKPEENAKANPDVDNKPTMIPLTYKTFVGEAAQKELSVAALQSLQAGMPSPEVGSYGQLVTMMLDLLEYDMITLNSPVSRADGSIIEYITKPRLPYYYAPICNVLLPNMYYSFNVQSMYSATPTRTVNLANPTAGLAGMGQMGPSITYTSPHSVRFARGGGASGNLGSSRSSYNNKVGKYEWGQGIRAQVTQLPTKYNLMRGYLEEKDTEGGGTEIIGAEYNAAYQAWNTMYPGNPNYNPLGTNSGIASFERLNFLYADQEFAQETAKARQGSATGVFNPYAIVGYPMDIVDPVPSRDSYHGFCTSITHDISADGMSSTTYGLTSVSTFAELAKFNLPAINPYLMATFDLAEDPRIYGNTAGYIKACQVYQEVLGVGAAEPALLQDYNTGTMIPFTRTADTGGHWTTDGEGPFYDTVQGSLMLVARNITSLYELEQERIADGQTGYVDIDDWIYTDLTDVEYKRNPTRLTDTTTEGGKIVSAGIDAESSPFLEY